MNEEPRDLCENLSEWLELNASENQKICKSDDSAISLANNGDWYVIEFSRCDTHEKVVKWINHLSPKAWVTKAHIELFIGHVFCRYPALVPKSIE